MKDLHTQRFTEKSFQENLRTLQFVFILIVEFFSEIIAHGTAINTAVQSLILQKKGVIQALRKASKQQVIHRRKEQHDQKLNQSLRNIFVSYATL